MQALHINGNNLTLEEVRQLVYERRPVLLQPEARGAVETRPRDRRRSGGERTRRLRGQYRSRPPCRHAHLASGHSAASAEPDPLPRCGSRRTAGRGCYPRHDVAAGQLAGQGFLRRAAHHHRYALRDVEPRRASGDPVAGQRGRQRRPGPVGPSCAGHDRRRRSGL